MWSFRTALVLILLLVSGAAQGVQPDEVLPDPALEARARTISQDLRCLVCQNQSIDDSAAPLARDLRLLVREQLKAGRTDQQVIDFLVERYGEFVLLRPKFETRTLVLWLAPFCVLLAGAIVLLVKYLSNRQFRQGLRTVTDEPALTAEEKRRLSEISGLP
jgi:cytochrome c-type biogenesis protein CcmH